MVICNVIYSLSRVSLCITNMDVERNTESRLFNKEDVLRICGYLWTIDSNGM
jgi:hypothetical protein